MVDRRHHGDALIFTARPDGNTPGQRVVLPYDPSELAGPTRLFTTDAEEGPDEGIVVGGQSSSAFDDFPLTGDRELVVLDIERARLSAVHAIDPAGPSDPRDFVLFEDRVYLVADVIEDGVPQARLFAKELVDPDGRPRPPRQLDDGFRGVDDLIVFDGQLVFTAVDDVNGRQLWTSNGRPGEADNTLITGALGVDDPDDLVVLSAELGSATGGDVLVFTGAPLGSAGERFLYAMTSTTATPVPSRRRRSPSTSSPPSACPTRSPTRAR